MRRRTVASSQKQGTKRFSLRAPAAAMDELQIVADKHQRSINGHLIYLIEQHLKKERKAA